jgi:outer membrane protein OmpA-like peptidoglycan-associated protein
MLKVSLFLFIILFCYSVVFSQKQPLQFLQLEKTQSITLFQTYYPKTKQLKLNRPDGTSAFSPSSLASDVLKMGLNEVIFEYIYRDDKTQCFAIPFSKSLIKDSLYCFSFSVLTSSIYLHKPQKITFLVSHKIPTFEFSGGMIQLDTSNLIATAPNEPFNSDKPTSMQLVYKATGGEKYLIFGMAKGTNPYIISDPSNRGKIAYETGNVLHFNKLRFYPYQKRTFTLPEASTFDYGKSLLKPEAFTTLDEWVRRLNDNPSTQIKITGYTDNQGSEELNLKLSKARALAVGQYLNSKGIERKRISLEGLGNQKPIESNDTEQGRAKNRRVEIEIINP